METLSAPNKITLKEEKNGGENIKGKKNIKHETKLACLGLQDCIFIAVQNLIVWIFIGQLKSN